MSTHDLTRLREQVKKAVFAEPISTGDKRSSTSTTWNT